MASGASGSIRSPRPRAWRAATATHAHGWVVPARPEVVRTRSGFCERQRVERGDVLEVQVAEVLGASGIQERRIVVTGLGAVQQQRGDALDVTVDVGVRVLLERKHPLRVVTSSPSDAVHAES